MLTQYTLLQAAEIHITASGLATEYAGFLAYFGVFGALGFRWLVLRRTAARQPEIGATGSPVALLLQSAEIGAARIGVIGAFFMLLNLLMALSARASDKGISFGSAIAAGGGRTMVAFLFIAVFLLSFVLAIRRVRAGWIIAALAGVIYALQGILSGRWTSLVNPLHEVAASLWIGTLFVVVVAGLPAILRSTLSSERRGALVADLIGDFSPVAIGAALLLVITGITTAWRHLKFVAALWTTPYGLLLWVRGTGGVCVRVWAPNRLRTNCAGAPGQSCSLRLWCSS
jgi:putative copper export protein